MATLGNTVLTFADIKNEYPRGTLREMAYLLEASSPFFANIQMKASNKTTSHVSTVQVGAPTVNIRKINQGVSSSIGTTEQIEDVITSLEIQTTTDVKLLEINDDPNEVRMSQMRMAMEAMRAHAEDLMFYGTPLDDPAEFYGLAMRDEFNALTSDHVVNSAGDSNRTSVWLVQHHPDIIHAIYPKNAKGGLYHRDWGEQLVQTQATIGGTKLPAVVDQYCLDLGLVVKDPRGVVRIANLDILDQVAVTGTGAINDYNSAIIFLLTDALHRLFNPSKGKLAWYCNRDMALSMAKQAQATGNQAGVYSYEQVWGHGPRGLHACGVPVFISDAISTNEDAVV